MVDFMKWKLKDSGFKKINSTKRRPIITHHVAHHPKHLNIRVLPDEMKSKIASRFEEFHFWCIEEEIPDNTFKKAMEITKSTMKYMMSDSYYNEYWDEFLDYTKKLDKIRNENLLDVEPVFQEYV